MIDVYLNLLNNINVAINIIIIADLRDFLLLGEDFF